MYNVCTVFIHYFFFNKELLRFHTFSWSSQEDDALQFLSREEQECLQFFEKTIDSLEESLEDNDQKAWLSVGTGGRSLEAAEGPLAASSALKLSSLHARTTSPKDQDIIDLVRPQPDLLQTKQSVFNPVTPGTYKIPMFRYFRLY